TENCQSLRECASLIAAIARCRSCFSFTRIGSLSCMGGSRPRGHQTNLSSHGLTIHTSLLCLWYPVKCAVSPLPCDSCSSQEAAERVRKVLGH
ncbi:mCG1036982, partial [Mus musculus]